MNLYTQNKNTLTRVKEKPITREKELQRLFERNLEHIFRLRFVKSECLIKKKR